MPEPVSLELMKQHLRLPADDTSEDTVLDSYIAAARKWVENYTGHVLVQREFRDQVDRFDSHFDIWRRPVVSVDGIDYTDTDGATQTYSGTPVVRLDRYPVRIHPELNGSWPALGANGDVVITYTAGYDAEAEPEELKQAIMLLAAHWFANREAVNFNATAAEMPFAVTALCDQHRVPML